MISRLCWINTTKNIVQINLYIETNWEPIRSKKNEDNLLH